MACGEEEVEIFLTHHVPLKLFGEERVLTVGVEQQC